jgi:hypothetical protein
MRRVVVGVVIVLIASSSHTRADRVRHRGADPDDLVTRLGEKVVNGCGPGATEVSDSWRFMDKHAFIEDGVSYTVNFRDACNLHDAGYEGFFYIMRDGKLAAPRVYEMGDGNLVRQPVVYDKLLDEDVSYSKMSREDVDARFFRDMQAECDQQIVPKPGDEALAADARSACKEWGQGPPNAVVNALLGPLPNGVWGAKSMWAMVRSYGASAFRTLGHKRKNDDPCLDHPDERGCRFAHYRDEDPEAPICMDRGRRFAADDEPCTDSHPAP